jgi:hypothetical protein
MKSSDKIVWCYMHVLYMYEYSFERNLSGPLAYEGAESAKEVLRMAILSQVL